MNTEWGERKNDYLHLIENDVVKAMESIERKRKQKLEKEASGRLDQKWDEEWQIERAEAERKWNETHDEDDKLIDDGTDDDRVDTNDTDDTAKSDERIEDENKDADDENEEGSEEEEGDDAVKRYFYEKKPKLVKRNHKTHKMVKDMCYFLNEKYDEWLHEQQSEISQKMKYGEKISDYLEPQQFCLEDKKLCKRAMFDMKPKIFKFKKELNLPKKPKRVWEPPKPTSQQIQEGADYEEQMEDDDDDVEAKQDEAQQEETKTEL